MYGPFSNLHSSQKFIENFPKNRINFSVPIDFLKALLGKVHSGHRVWRFCTVENIVTISASWKVAWFSPLSTEFTQPLMKLNHFLQCSGERKSSLKHRKRRNLSCGTLLKYYLELWSAKRHLFWLDWSLFYQIEDWIFYKQSWKSRFFYKSSTDWKV